MKQILNKEDIKVFAKVLIVLYIFLTCFTWSIATEYDSAPDEKMKYDVCEYLYKNLKLPQGGDESIRDSEWGISYAFTPILSYMLSAGFMRIVSIFNVNGFNLLVAARFISVLCITGYAIMCIKISQKLFKGIYKYLFVAFATLLPQLLYLGSYIDNDSIALLSISIIIYSWIIGLESNWNWKSCIIMAIGIGICALSYYNTYGYILCSIIIYLISSYIKKVNIKEFLKKGIVISIITLMIAGWWFVRNYIIYDGDFLGLSTSREYGEMYATEKYKPSKRKTPANKNVSLKYMLNDMKWIKLTKLSFIGLFGYMNVVMHYKIYWIYKLFIKIGIIGIILKILKIIIQKCINRIKKNEIIETDDDKVKKEDKILLNIIFIISILITVGLSLYYSYFMDFQPQGRYIMPMIIPFMYFIVMGTQDICDFLIRNEIIKNILLTLVILMWIIMPIYIFWNYIIFL